MKIPYLKNNIAYRILIYIFMFSSFVTLIITSIQLKIEYKRDLKSIDEQFLNIEKSFQKQISESLWFFNEKSLIIHLKGISNLKDIEYIELVGEGDVFLKAGQKFSEHTIEKNFPITYITKNTKREIGNLKVIASKSNVYSRLINRLIIILISQSIKTFIVSIFIFLLFHFIITRHILVIDNYLKKYELGKELNLLDLKRKRTSSKDELDQMVTSINEASKKLNEAYEYLEHKVEQRTNDLTEANIQLNRSLEEVKTLRGIIPICSYCKKIRDDQGAWEVIEAYICKHSDAQFSHGACPKCYEKQIKDFE